MARAGQVVVHAPDQQRAAVTFGAGANGVCAQPQGAHNAFVQRLAGHQVTELAAKGKAQIGDVVAPVSQLALKARQVDTDQRRGAEMKGGFFQRLSRAGLNRALARVQVAGRVVQAQAFGRVLLDQQKLGDAGYFSGNDGSHRGAGFPSCVHAQIILWQNRAQSARAKTRPDTAPPWAPAPTKGAAHKCVRQKTLAPASLAAPAPARAGRRRRAAAR